ncbi:MAG: M10 family metallopeptidase C-terminal domain-containing protein [Pseudomonadota bacterium]
MNGGADDDVIVGGTGFDLLTGGSGADVFVFDQAVDGDTITDFNSGEDLLDISQLMRMADSLTLVLEAIGPKGGDIISDVSTGITNGGSSRLIVTATEQDGGTLLTVTNLAPVIGSALADLHLQVLLEGVDINLLSVDDFMLS